MVLKSLFLILKVLFLGLILNHFNRLAFYYLLLRFYNSEKNISKCLIFMCMKMKFEDTVSFNNVKPKR